METEVHRTFNILSVLILCLVTASSAFAQASTPASLDDIAIKPAIFGSNAGFNTAQIQIAIDEAARTGKYVQLPPGRIKVNDSFTIHNMPGMVIRGTSPSLQDTQGTKLEWVGDSFAENPDSPGELIPSFMFHVRNSSHYLFEEISVHVSQPLGAFLYTTTDREDPESIVTTAGGMHRVFIDGINGNILHGVHIGPPPPGQQPANDSEAIFDRVTIMNFGYGGPNQPYANFEPSGILNEQNQAKQILVRNSAIGCAVSMQRNAGYGIHITRGGTLTWDGNAGGIFSCRWAIKLDQNIGGRNLVEGGDFEGNRGFINVKSGFHQNTLTIRDVRIARNEMKPGDVHFELATHGPVLIEGIGIDPGPHAAEVAVRWTIPESDTYGSGRIPSPASLTIQDSTIGSQLDDASALMLYEGTHTGRVVDVQRVVMVNGDFADERHWWVDTHGTGGGRMSVNTWLVVTVAVILFAVSVYLLMTLTRQKEQT